jgi:hypothetical protein
VKSHWWPFTVSALGAAAAWRGRRAMNPDGISYLDLSDHFLTGQWSQAFDPYWSSGYPAVIALVRRLIGDSRWVETSVVHALNFVIFCACVFLFWRFLGRFRLQSPVIDAVCWSVFLWTTLTLVNLRTVTPDMAVFAVVLVMATAVADLVRGEGGLAPPLALGIGAAGGFLLKAAMLPVGIGALVLAAALARNRSRAVIAILPFVVGVLGVVTTLKTTTERWTVGDAGRLNYAWYIGGVTPHVHWTGNGNTGRPLHPPQLINRDPDVYVFDPLGTSTYSLWGRPSYWHEGLSVRPSVSSIFATAPDRALEWWTAVAPATGALAGMLVLAILGGRWTRERLAVGGFAAAPLLMYSVVHVEGRLVAPFLCLLLVLGTVTDGVPDLKRSALAIAVTAWFAAVVLQSLAAEYIWPRAADERHEQFALNVTRQGVVPGSHVAVVGDAFNAYWARLAGVHITGEVPSRHTWEFRNLSTPERRRIECALAARGVTALIDDGVVLLRQCPEGHR